MRADAAPTPARQARPAIDERRRAKARSVRVRRLTLIGGSVVVLALAVGIGVGFAGSSDRIADGVTIAGIDVSGMTAEQATRALERQAADLADEPIVFTAGDQTVTLRPKRLGIEGDWEAAVARALGESDGFILFRGYKRLALRFGGSDIEAAVTAQPGLPARTSRRSRNRSIGSRATPGSR